MMMSLILDCRKFLAGMTCLLLLLSPFFAQAERIKDIAQVAGVRSNQLVGYGLVVGLDGSGDGAAAFTSQSLKSMLNRLGVIMPTDVNLRSEERRVGKEGRR